MPHHLQNKPELFRDTETLCHLSPHDCPAPSPRTHHVSGSQSLCSYWFPCLPCPFRHCLGLQPPFLGSVLCAWTEAISFLLNSHRFIMYSVLITLITVCDWMCGFSLLQSRSSPKAGPKLDSCLFPPHAQHSDLYLLGTQ